MRKTKTVSLVLGSGGARGLAHIGVIKWLEENDYQIKSISGCSIGSLIGGVYAAGKLPQLEKWMRSLKKIDVVSLLDVSWVGGGLFKGDKIINTLISLIGDIQIEDLAIPFTAMAADIEAEKEVWINSGGLFGAIRASVSLPMFFTPYDYHGIKLIDGGVLNPVPIAPTFNDDTDLIIAVNLGGSIIKEVEQRSEAIKLDDDDSIIQKAIKKLVLSIKETERPEVEKGWGMYDVADKAFDAMQGTIGRLKIAAYPPDIEIVIPRNACDTMDFDKSAEMIALGYQKARDAASALINDDKV